jgi:predicted N-formylglutamate amidohydrolase
MKFASVDQFASSYDPDNPAFGVIEGNLSNNLVIISDHARNSVPEEYHQLGLPAGEFERHIAYDIGAEDLTRQLAEKLQAPAVYSKFSRLLIDPNRGTDDPTLIMKISDGALVPGNVDVDGRERQKRIDTYYQPYHDAITAMIDAALASGKQPVILSIHSFTPSWKGVPRPWHAGVLWEYDNSFAGPLIAKLALDRSLVVGENEPYSGGIPGDSVDKHAYLRHIPAALIEIRQDLICDKSGVDEWAERLAQILPQITISQ